MRTISGKDILALSSKEEQGRQRYIEESKCKGKTARSIETEMQVVPKKERVIN